MRSRLCVLVAFVRPSSVKHAAFRHVLRGLVSGGSQSSSENAHVIRVLNHRRLCCYVDDKAHR